MTTLIRLSLAACLCACVPVGQEGIASRSRSVTYSISVEKEEAAAIPNGADLFLYMVPRYCQKYAQRTGAVPRGHGDVDLGDSYGAIITALMCHKQYSSGYGGPESSGFARILFATDDRVPNHLHGAIALVLCTGEKWCNGPIATGHMAWFAENIDRAAVRTALANVEVAPEMRLAFLRRADAASQLILWRANNLDPRRKALYRDLVNDVRTKRRAHWKTYAAHWDRFDRLAARSREAVSTGSADAELIREISVLRDDYFNACVATGQMRDECLHGQLARPLTHELVKLSIAAKDAVLATTENAVLQSGTDRSTLAQATHAEQFAAMKEERARYDRMARARREGADEATIRNTFGVPLPIKIDAASSFRPPRSKSNYKTLIAELGRTMTVRGIVKNVRKSRKHTTISFESDMRKPVTVPHIDARGIKRGQEVVAVCDEERSGYVVVVKEGRNLVGVRMFR